MVYRLFEQEQETLQVWVDAAARAFRAEDLDAGNVDSVDG